MERLDLIPELRTAAPGDHLCHLFSTQEQRVEVAFTFLRDGLERGERTIYVADGGKAEEDLRSLFTGRGLDMRGYAERGQLLLYEPGNIFLTGEGFSPSSSLASWREEARRASSEGWPAMRVLADMSWALRKPPGWELLAEYEAEINRLPGAESCLFLCQYDRRSFDPQFLLDLLRTHPRVLVDEELYDNIYYLPPGEFLNNMAPASVLNHHFLHLAERRRAVREIEEARAFAQAVVDTVREPLLVLDADLRVMAANRSFYHAFRTTPEETEGRLIYDLGDRQWDIPELRKLLEEIIPLNTRFEDYAVEHDFPGLGRKTMMLNARRIHREGDGTRLILLAVEDVTEKRAAEEELRRRERYFHCLVENAYDAVTVLDAEARHVYASPSVERVLGWKPEELLGRTPFEFMHPDELRGVWEVFQEGISHPGTVKEIIHRWRDSGGNWRIVESSGINLLDDPHVGGVVINCRDITRQMLDQRRVHRLNRMFLSLGADFLSNMEAVIRACREILEADVAAYARPEGEKMTLLTTLPGEEGLILVEESGSFAGHPLFAGHAGPLILGAEGEGGLPEGDPLVEAHGYRLFVGQSVIQGERITGVLATYFRDRRSFTREDLETLTILCRTLAIEEERLAREQGLKDFIDVASHELRHPITLIKGYALSLKERFWELSGERVAEILGAIDEGADRITRLVESLLDISRIERGQLELEPREVDLPPLLRRAVGEMSAVGRKTVLRLRGRVGTCFLDPDRFLEVLHILLDNAHKFSPPGGVVEVEALERGGEYLISVRDRGIGVPEEYRELIFDRFYQVEKPRYHSKPGMGMGLYIAREIVERQGGRIWYEPRKGGGSVFRFTIPR